MLPGNEDGLPDGAVGGRDLGDARREGARRALAVDAQRPRAVVVLELGDVVGDVVDLARAVGDLRAEDPRRSPRGRGGRAWRGWPRRSSRRRPSRAEVARPLGRGQRRAGELAVGQHDAVAAPARRPCGARSRCRPGGRARASPEWMSTVTWPSRSPNAVGARRVDDLGDALHLDEVVARAERPELVGAARPGALGDRGRVGARPGSRRDSVSLDVLGGADAVFGSEDARALRRAPGRAARRRAAARRRGRRRPGRGARSRARAARCARPSSAGGQRQREQAHAAVDVVADAAGEITPSGGSVAATPPTGKP